MRDESEIERMDAAGPLTGVYRPIRRVAPPESPYAGTLAKVAPDSAPGADDSVVVLVDAAGLAHWAGWSVDDEQHVVGPIDMARRAQAHDVVVPWCKERIETFLARRASAEAPLSGGEVVTVAVSVLRGTAEVWQGREPAGPGPAGTWWLTDDGRPVFVHATSDEGEPVESGARRIIQSLSDGGDDRTVARLLERAVVLCDKPRQLSRVIDEWEGNFFAVNAPRPLDTAIFPSALARGVETASLRASPQAPTPSASTGRLRHLIARHIDADLADMVAVRAGEVVKGLRSRLSKGHRLPWLAAGGVAAVIVLGGVLWPTGEVAQRASAEAPAASMPPSSPASAPGTQSAPAAETGVTEGTVPEGSVPEDSAPEGGISEGGVPESGPPESEIVIEAGRLLDSLAVFRAASDTAVCMTAIAEAPGLVPPPGAVDAAAPQRVIALVDDYGGAGLVQVSAAGTALSPQLVVIVKREDKWLLRDVYDVAKQPDG